MKKEICKKWQKYPVFVPDVVTVLDNTTKSFNGELLRLRKLIQRGNKKQRWIEVGTRKHAKNL
jgi:hypothetical protein